VRVDDFVAETLESEADMMPPWTKFQAGIWRDVAKDLRASESTKMVRVWEELLRLLRQHFRGLMRPH
jgi:hypothetical protein